MATFLVQNLSGVKLAVPPPVSRILAAGASAEVEADSLDTDAIADLINTGKIKVIPQPSDSAGAEAVEAALKSLAPFPTTLLGAAGGGGVTLADGEVLTFTHGLNVRPVMVLPLDDTDGGIAPSTVTVGGTVNTVTVTNGSGGPLDLNVLIMFPAGTAPLGSTIAATDSRIAVA